MKLKFLIIACFYNLDCVNTEHKYYESRSDHITMRNIEDDTSREQFFYKHYELFKTYDKNGNIVFLATGCLNQEQQKRLFDKLVNKETLDEYDECALMYCWASFTNDKKKETFEDLKSQLTKNNFNLSERISLSFGWIDNRDKTEILQFLSEQNIFHSEQLASLIITCPENEKAALILLNHPKTKDAILNCNRVFIKIEILYSYMNIEQKKEYFNFLLNQNSKLFRNKAHKNQYKDHLTYFYCKLSNELETNEFEIMMNKLNITQIKNFFTFLLKHLYSEEYKKLVEVCKKYKISYQEKHLKEYQELLKKHWEKMNFFYSKLSSELEPNNFKNMINELNSQEAENLFKILSQKEILSKKDFDLLTYVYFAKKQGSFLPIVWFFSNRKKL